MSDECCEVNTIILASTLFCTVVMACYARLQYSISNEARKDGLFKIRYEFYLEICQFILNGFKKEFAQEFVDDNLSEGIFKKTPYFEDEGKSIVIKASFLFGKELADFLTKCFKHRKTTIDSGNSTDSNDFWEKLGSYDRKSKIWSPNEEFNAQFEKHLKLK